MLKSDIEITSTPSGGQIDLLEALEKESPELANIYRGILHDLQTLSAPNRVRVLAYQARELMMKAPIVMSPYGAALPAKPPAFSDLKKQLQMKFDKLNTELALQPVNSTSRQVKCTEFLSFVASWLLKADKARPDYERLVLSQVTSLEPTSSAHEVQRLRRAVRRWRDLKETFDGVLHGQTQLGMNDIESRVSELEDFLLHRLRPRPFANLSQLDGYLARGPDTLVNSEIQTLLGLIDALSVNYRYFFQQLNSPDWIPLLEKLEFFKTPPELQEIEDQVIAMDWPELVYLERVTLTATEAVGRIARAISRLEPDNPRVHESLVRISTLLLQENSKHGKRLLNLELDWIKNQSQLQLQMPRFLLTAAAVSAVEIPGLAMRATRALLSLEISTKIYEQRGRGNWHRLSTWGIGEVLDQLVENLLPVLPAPSQMKLLGHLCEFLNLVGENEFETTDPNAREAIYQMWRPAIEDHEQNSPNSNCNQAIEAVRNAADALVKTHGISIFEHLEKSGFQTLMRISIHLRRKHPLIDPEGTAKLVTNQQILDNDILQHELLLLLQEQFSLLPIPSQNGYLEWLAKLKDPYKRYSYLWPIRDSLSDKLLEEYQQYEDEFGKLDHADLLASRGVEWIGPTSPLSITEMLELEIPELVTQLNQWVFTPGGWRVPEPEGLARELAAFAAQDASRVSEQAVQFAQLQQPTCVRGIVQGLANAVKEGKRISWQPVLNFCEWAVEQERGEGPEGNGLDEFDRTWGPARKQIAWLLLRGTERSTVEIPFKLKDAAWLILNELIKDPDPTMDEESDRSTSMDPSTIAINTVRGVSLSALFSFASWVTRHNPQEEKTWARFGLGDMAVLLEEMLSNENAPSVRSVFGRGLFYLFWLDQSWTEQNVDEIFPIEKPKIWAAAWEAFLMFSSSLCLEFLPLLGKSYEHALDKIGSTRTGATRPANVDERLGNHLVLYFREGVLKREDVLFQQFFEKADSKLRHKVMFGAVRQVQNISEERRAKAIELLQDLWEWRSEVSIEEEAGDQHELSSFAWWFLKDEFPAAWRIQQLALTQASNVKLALDGRVLAKLGELAAERLSDVVSCLEAIVKNPSNQHWDIYDDHVKAILGVALDSGDLGLYDKTENLVHYIGALGYLGYRDLLLNSDTEDKGDTK